MANDAIPDSSPLAAVAKVLTPRLLQEVRDFWYQYARDETELVLPQRSEMLRWFTRDAEFDRACVTRFRPALDTILQANIASSDELLAAASITSPLDWISLVLLMDQIGRNCYRDQETRVVYQNLDHLSRNIALKAIDSGIARTPRLKYYLAYRFWFYMPLMHSEEAKFHQEEAPRRFDEMTQDVEWLLTRDEKEVETLSEDERFCYRVLSGNAERARGFVASNLRYEKLHTEIVQRFGRYPHRNKPLGRDFTEEELEYVKNGGETFGIKVIF